MLTTRLDFAAKLGVSRARVTQLVAEGMPSTDDARIDVDAAFAWIRANCSPDSKVYRAVADIDKANGGPPRREDAAEPETGSDEEDPAEDFIAKLLSGTYRDKAEAERIKENALAGLRTLELQRKAGELVEFSVAKTVLFEQARTYRDALLQWPQQAGPLIAADLDVPAEDVTERLNEYIRELLSELGEPDPESAFGESE